MVDLLKFASAIKNYGIIKTLKIISRIGWFILPLLVWIHLYRYFGPVYFSFSLWVYLGLVMSFFLYIFSIVNFIQYSRIDWKMMKNVEGVKQLFEAPRDPKFEEKFRLECRKFLMPYLHFRQFFKAGARKYLKQHGFFGSIIMNLIQIVIPCFLSYSIFVLLIEIQPLVNLIITSFAGIPYFSGISLYFSSLLELILQNPLISTVVFFIIAFPTVYLGLARAFNSLWIIVHDIFSILNRIFIVGAYFLTKSLTLNKRDLTLDYEPFTFPQNLPEIIQKSILNIENRVSYVTKYVYEGKDENDIRNLRQEIINQKEIPIIIRGYCKIADCGEMFQRVINTKPVLFLGLIDRRCAFMGKILYDTKQKIYYANFFFDNKHIRNQFREIAQIHIDEQKKLKQEHSKDILELLKKMTGG